MCASSRRAYASSRRARDGANVHRVNDVRDCVNARRANGLDRVRREDVYVRLRGRGYGCLFSNLKPKINGL